MSGIAVSYGVSDEAGVKRMLGKLEHRGDSSGIKTLKNMTLGYRKNNMNREKRPEETVTSNGKISAICDGYIFNGEHLEHDSGNLIIKSYQDKGINFPADLEGYFALAIADGDSLLLARDPFGIKPLYYGRHNDTMYFASEMKELLEVTADINIFPPGHYYTPEQGFQTLTRKAGEGDKITITGDPEKAALQLKQSIIHAVEKRYLQNERPGILLSGGLDSSIIAAAVRQIGESMQTFAVGMVGSPDLEAASLVARHLGTEHHEHVYTKEEIMAVLSKIIYHLESFDAPLVQSAIANYFASRLAATAGCHSVLCGEGADELFGGYHYVKNLGSEAAMQKEIESIFYIGHAMGFQRVDRMNSANSLESHIPFMDLEILDFAAATPLDWKIYGPQQVEKWILRRAFKDDLPEKVVWRRKAQFSHGTNCDSVMDDLSDACITDEAFEKAKKQNGDVLFRTKEEYLYYNIFKEHFPQEAAIKCVVQWSELEGDIC